MTVEGIIQKSRVKLLDTSSPYRWSDKELRDGVRMAVRHIRSVRPETRYVGGVLHDFGVTDDTSEIPIDDRFEEALAYYVVYYAYLKDDADTVNAQLAESYLAKSEKWMQL